MKKILKVAVVTAVAISAIELVFKGGALYGVGLNAGIISKSLEIEDDFFERCKKPPFLTTYGFKHGVDLISKERES